MFKKIERSLDSVKKLHSTQIHPRTWSIRTSYLAITVLQEPFVVLYSMLAILLSKNLGATPFEIALLNMLKPTVSVISFYWGSYLHRHTSLTKSSLMIATVLAIAPFIFSPLIHSVSVFIFIGAWYSLFTKAATPASLELLKLNTIQSERERLFSICSILAYTISGTLSVFYGFLLDYSPSMWIWLFSFAASIHLLSVYAQKKIPSPPASKDEILSTVSKAAQESSWYDPWKLAKELMLQRPDFLRFQIGFSIAGFGLMFSQPAIPGFVTNLHLSYTEIFISLSLLKGLGFIITSPIWTRMIANVSIYALSGAVFLGFSFYFISLLLTAVHSEWLFIAYLLYGIAQAGSHLIWNMSGSIFSKTENSTPFSSVNVLMVGLRGAIAPPLGGLVAQIFGAHCCMSISIVLCIVGTSLIASESIYTSFVSKIRYILRNRTERL